MADPKVARDDGGSGGPSLSAAVQHHQEGRLAEAEALYQRVLDAQPDQPDALHFLGVLRHQQRRSKEGLELIRRAISLRPEHPDMHNNLGNVLRGLRRPDEAEAAYRAAIALAPGMSRAHHNLGTVLRQQGRTEPAIASYDRAIGLDPDNAETHHNRGNILRQLGRLLEASVAYQRALSLDPGNERAYANLGQVLCSLGAVDAGCDVFRQWEAREPGNPFAIHMLAACSGQDVPGRASDGYVGQLFDNFADDYDENLLELGYRVPEWVGAVLPEYLAARDGRLSVLDAGCGTGLCATVLRPYAGRLTGVDLSPAMLDRARERGGYDELVWAELTGFLKTQEAAHDLIVSADTLVYFGALESVLGAASQALRPGGLLLFTVEDADESPDDGYRLNPHGRYSHSRDYLERVIPGAGLTLASLRSGVLRKEGGHPANGWMAIARRPNPQLQ